MIKKALKKVREWFFKQKYRFDIGLQFMVFLNFTLLVVTASDKLKQIIPIDTRYLLVILVPSAFIGMWLFGYILDKFVKSQHFAESEYYERSPLWKGLYERLDRIEQNVNKQKGVNIYGDKD